MAKGIGKRYSLIFLCACCLSLAHFGCATAPFRAHPELDNRIQSIKTLGLASPDIKIYELTAGGIRELRDDWCVKGKENVQGALIECLGEESLIIKPITIDTDLEEEMEDIYALYRAVSTSIVFHTYGEHKFPEKVKNFDYSIGSIEKILKRYESDSLVFIYGMDEISTGGRKALKAAAIIAGALTGVMILPRSGITAMSVALIDPSGTILWYNIKASEGGYDLRDPESALNLVKEILAYFPGIGK